MHVEELKSVLQRKFLCVGDRRFSDILTAKNSILGGLCAILAKILNTHNSGFQEMVHS